MKMDQKNKLYHKDVYMPQEFLKQVPGTVILLSYSNHAMDRLEYYGVEKFNSVRGSVIEVEVSNGLVVKALIRAHFDKKNDISVAVGFADRSGVGFVKTLWLNKKGSCRTWLNKQRYEKGPD